MKKQLSGLTAGADGMAGSMKAEMDAMRKELSGLTAGLHEQLGAVADLQKLKGKGSAGPEKRTTFAKEAGSDDDMD